MRYLCSFSWPSYFHLFWQGFLSEIAAVMTNLKRQANLAVRTSFSVFVPTVKEDFLGIFIVPIWSTNWAFILKPTSWVGRGVSNGITPLTEGGSWGNSFSSVTDGFLSSAAEERRRSCLWCFLLTRAQAEISLNSNTLHRVTLFTWH